MPTNATDPALMSASQPYSLECAVTAHTTARFSIDEINALRKQSDALPGALGNAVLRHADEQSLAALAAVQCTIGQFHQRPADFSNWGVVTSSRYVGRSVFAQLLQRYASEGPWNVSVQIVPNRSLHSPASLVGQALGCHGPCVGVGGGSDGETDAWITASMLLDQQSSLEGIFLIFTGWDPDFPIDADGVPLVETHCTALVLALQAASNANACCQLRITVDPTAPAELQIPVSRTTLDLFEDFLAAQASGQPLSTTLGGCLRAEVTWSTAVTSKDRPILSNPQRKAA